MRTSVYQTISRYFFALLFLFILIGCELDDDDGLDTSILESKIEEAVSLFEDTEISVDGTNVLRDKYWVTQDDYDIFEKAIEKAQDALNANAQIEIAKAVSDLHNAINNFMHKDTRKTGSRVTKGALENLIEKAEAAKEGIKSSEHSGDDILPDAYWAPQGTINNLNNAIAYAKKTIEEAPDDADENDFEEAYIELELYLANFEISIRRGSDKAGSIADLDDKINEASLAIRNVVKAESALEVQEGVLYTESSNFDAIENAIKTAQAALNNDTLTKKDLDDAISVLNAALAVFTASRKEGRGSISYITINNIDDYEGEDIWVGFYDAPPENEEHRNINYAYKGVSKVENNSVIIEMSNRNFESWVGTGSYHVLILAGSDTNNFGWEYEASYISSSKINFTAQGTTTVDFRNFKKHAYSFKFDNIADDLITLDEETTLDDWFQAVEKMTYGDWCKANNISLYKDYSLSDAYSGEDLIEGETIYARIPVEFLFRKLFEDEDED